MEYNRGQVEEEVMGLIKNVTQDWDYSKPITSETLLFSELGFESLDAVVFGTAIQKHFQKQMPFAELLAELGKESRDLSISELVDFVRTQLS